VDFIQKLEEKHPDRDIAVVIPMLVKLRWYHYFLHGKTGELLSGLLLLKAERRIAIVNVPWHLA